MLGYQILCYKSLHLPLHPSPTLSYSLPLPHSIFYFLSASVWVFYTDDSLNSLICSSTESSLLLSPFTEFFISNIVFSGARISN